MSRITPAIESEVRFLRKLGHLTSEIMAQTGLSSEIVRGISDGISYPPLGRAGTPHRCEQGHKFIGARCHHCVVSGLSGKPTKAYEPIKRLSPQNIRRRGDHVPAAEPYSVPCVHFDEADMDRASFDNSWDV